MWGRRTRFQGIRRLTDALLRNSGERRLTCTWMGARRLGNTSVIGRKNNAWGLGTSVCCCETAYIETLASVTDLLGETVFIVAGHHSWTLKWCLNRIFRSSKALSRRRCERCILTEHVSRKEKTTWSSRLPAKDDFTAGIGISTKAEISPEKDWKPCCKKGPVTGDCVFWLRFFPHAQGTILKHSTYFQHST